MARTMAEKVWEEHVVRRADGEPDLLYIDLQLLHEVTSPQAFEGLRLAGRSVRRPDQTLATEDHNVPTQNLLAPIADPVSRKQVETLRKNCSDFGVRLYPMGDIDQGIVHVVGPQLGLTQPGMTVCAVTATPAPTVPSARWPSVSAPARSNTCWPPRHCPCSRSRPWPSPSTEHSIPGSRPRTSSSPSSPRSVPAAVRGMSSSTGARPSSNCRWRPA